MASTKKSDKQPSLFENKSSTGQSEVNATDFSLQVNFDQKRYSRYVCDSRAIPNAIDGLKPVQRRILWTMWNSSAKTHFTKTVKVAGMTMAYHPHGNASIEDAIAGMVQGFSFANNYPLLEGEGTFGDVLDPKAIASPRYTEVRLSKFAHDAGFFESLEDIAYVTNYDDTAKEPIFFVPKLPTVLLNPTIGIATGFRCSFPARNIKDVSNAMLNILNTNASKNLTASGITPWFNSYSGNVQLITQEQGRYYITNFAFTTIKNSTYLTAAPQGWNREKTINYLEALCKDASSPLKDYFDASMSTYKIELMFSRGFKPTGVALQKLFSKFSKEGIEQNIISANGILAKKNDSEIITEFLKTRLALLRTRFTRFTKIQQQNITKQSELIRFISEKWHQKIPLFKNKETLEQTLANSNFTFTQWLSGLPIYRLTANEIKKAQEAITVSKKQMQYYKTLATQKKALFNFISEEVTQLCKKYS